MNHAQLKAFHAVAETGGFSSAAKMLGLTQPAVTLQVQALEQNYNTKLFQRHGRKTEITSSGKMLLKLSKRIFNLEAEAHTLLTSLDTMEAGNLNVIAPSSLQALPFLSVFHSKYPKIRLSFLSFPPSQIEKEITDFRADIAIQHLPPEDNRLFTQKIDETPLKLAVSKDHAWSQKQTVTLKELKELTDPIIIPPSELEATGKLRGHWSTYFNFGVKQTLMLQSREIGREAVANSLGVAFYTDADIRWDKRIHGIEIEDERFKEATYITCLKEERQSRLIASFFESTISTDNP
ncbi:LysR substrate-binding domain-containing protein [Sneathiella sp. HT1-7]|uniref:LysR substrate-binding domain-containing protein n=1 Tax=Sneathiella sp. HT1-7 TaxID=2887192 RepID=UPI001D14B1FB|nr:LysR substrate-binding domain-containing protein [Sneathiella sp. HT1-7]MCC3304543.1 LysR family transcriptional regulator [Sneathiella sp. HT1-7]